MTHTLTNLCQKQNAVGHEVGKAFRHLEVTLERLLAPGVYEINLGRGGFSIEAYK